MADICAQVGQLHDLGITRTTAASYFSQWQRFQQFQVAYQIHPANSIGALEHYVAFLMLQDRSPKTIQHQLLGIGHWLKRKHLPDVTQSASIKRISVGINQSIKPDSRKACTWPIILNLINTITKTNSNKFQVALYSAAITTGYAALLRPSEYTANQLQHTIQFSSLTIYPDRITMWIPHSKTNPLPHLVTIHNDHQQPNPDTLLINYLRLRPKRLHRNLFLKQDGSPLTAQAFREYMAKITALTGYDPRELTPHTLRMGHTTDYANQDKPESFLKREGRWLGDTFQKYIRLPPKPVTPKLTSKHPKLNYPPQLNRTQPVLTTTNPLPPKFRDPEEPKPYPVTTAKLLRAQLNTNSQNHSLWQAIWDAESYQPETVHGKAQEGGDESSNNEPLIDVEN